MAVCDGDLHIQPRRYNSKYIARRAMMYVPGNDEKKLNKIPTLNADCVVMDCEDGVALNRKVMSLHFCTFILLGVNHYTFRGYVEHLC